MSSQGRHRAVGYGHRQERRRERNRSDPRYGTSRWRKLAKRVLVRDLHHCFIANCPHRATIADHIEPVHLGMPDSLFFSPVNLRASCVKHNTYRGHAAVMEQDEAGGVRPLPRRYSYGDAPPPEAGPSPFTTVTSDYSRREAGDGAA